MQRFQADWVLPVSGKPIASGAVLVADNGRLAAVGRTDELPHADGVRVETLPSGVVLLPGLVNAHTHLELTGLAGLVDEPDFQRWIMSVIRIKAARSDAEFFEAACRGIRSMWAAGVTTIADTGSTGMVLEALDHLGASGTAHHEVFGAHPEQCETAMGQFAADLNRLALHATGRVSLGVSPHAPYTVSGSLYRASCELARAHGVPIAVHTAEPPDESALLADFTGSFARQFQNQGIPRPSQDAISPVAFMDRQGVWGPRTLCIHAIHTSLADTELLARHGSAIAHCPRSNRFHHGAEAPVRRYRDHGLRIGLGTDSELSVNPPDLLAEARAAMPLAGWTPREAIRALTLGGAEALELDREVGSLQAGKWADMTAIRVGPDSDPELGITLAGAGDVFATWLAGREVFRWPGAG